MGCNGCGHAGHLDISPKPSQARRRLTMAIRVLCPNDGKDEAGGLWAKDTEGRGLSCLAMPAALEAQGKGKKKKVPNGRRLTEDERCWHDVFANLWAHAREGRTLMCCAKWSNWLFSRVVKFQQEGITMHNMPLTSC